MSVRYQAVGWNRQKKLYDSVVASGVLLYVGLFLVVGAWWNPHSTVETLILRASGTAAFLLVHVVLSIGPLCRLSPRFLPLLYNRRHLGVVTFLLGLVHGLFSLVQFHFLGNVHPLVSLFTASARYESLAWFPFQPLGFAALGILFLMAATSHDFWLATLGPSFWKTLHMLVYAAYALLVGHVALGILQAETSPVFSVLLVAGATLVVGLHLVAGGRSARKGREATGTETAEGFRAVCRVAEIPREGATQATLNGTPVAIFRHGDQLSAVHGVCAHQNGPLAEGRIIAGCITCPWHGYQYRPDDGCSPPPFREKLATYAVRVEGDQVLVQVRPQPPGTRIEPARVPTREGPG